MVFELNSTVEQFQKAAAELGFEWLFGQAESPAETEEDDEASVGATLYITMPSIKGLRRLLSCWQRFKKGEPAPSDDKPLWALFSRLLDVRPWSAKDRIDASTQRYLSLLLARDDSHPVLVEVDLWFRDSLESRKGARSLLGEMLQQVGGQELDFVSIPEIRYEAALISVPPSVAKQLINREGKIANAEAIMAIRPQSNFAVNTAPPCTLSMPAILPVDQLHEEPIAVLLDGYPAAQHPALQDRLKVIELDVLAAHVPAKQRRHGTAMASLVLHGDLHKPSEVSLQNKIALIPVLSSDEKGEAIPKNKLAIGLIYRAILHAIGTDTQTGVCPKTVIFNHSICNQNSPFIRRASPWANLLDHYSHNAKVLFIVSAGNINSGFKINGHESEADFLKLEPESREASTILSFVESHATRGLLSPAESINSLTVGALHSDEGDIDERFAFDPFPNLSMPGIYSALGLGINNSIKPEIVEAGGRVLARVYETDDGLMLHGVNSPHVGQLVAAPDPSALNPSYVETSAGTSNAAALVTRQAIQISQILKSLFETTNERWHDSKSRAVMLKALLVHGCSWDSIGKNLETAYETRFSHWHSRRQTIGRLIGYGNPSIHRVIRGTANRITLLASDEIKHNQLHEYRVPIPTGMIGNRELRQITITLAWSTPIQVDNIVYRGVKLQLVNKKGKQGRGHFWKAVTTKEVPLPPGVNLGTLTHLQMRGSQNCKEIVDEAGLFFGVQAMASAPSMHGEMIPYAMAITVELANPVRTSTVYAEVSERVQRARSRTRQRAGRG